MIESLPTNYLVTLWLHNVILAIVSLVTGWMVVRWGVKTNYTRKINHFALMMIPFGLGPLLPYQVNSLTITMTLVVFVFVTLIYLRPIRERFSIVQTAFASVDRPEDRPYTLLWIVTQAIASYFVLVGVFLLIGGLGQPELVAIPVIITGVGDGLAEPIGVRFGKHQYRVPSLVAGRQYTRSIEGSACVMVVSIVVILLAAGGVTSAQWWALLLVVPIVMTLAEAWSPHSWDAPILYAVGGATVYGILLLI